VKIGPRAVAFGLLAAYLVTARGVGNLYPFSTFEMYGSATTESASRIIVLEGDEPREVREYAGFDCAQPVSPDPRACLSQWPFTHLPEVDAAAARAINRSSGTGADVRIVRRIWRFEDGETIEDCVLAMCRAERP
jgi:hypothetical protein